METIWRQLPPSWTFEAKIMTVYPFFLRLVSSQQRDCITRVYQLRIIKLTQTNEGCRFAHLGISSAVLSQKSNRHVHWSSYPHRFSNWVETKSKQWFVRMWGFAAYWGVCKNDETTIYFLSSFYISIYKFWWRFCRVFNLQKGHLAS